MKKLSLLIAMILVVTISGVYATWNYSRNVVDSKQASATVVVTGTQSSTKGVITIESAPKRVIIDDTNNDHVAELFFGDIDASSHPVDADKLGTINVKFTPAASGVDAEVAASGIYMAWDLTASNLGAFDIDGDDIADAIFVIKQSHGHFNNGQRAKEASINIADCIELNVIGKTGENPGTPIKLDTYAKYQAFENAIKNITFTLTVSEWDGVAHNG